MPDTSARLALPYIAPAQAQKHVTHNSALERLDILVQLTVVAFDATTPPASPTEGETHALGAAPTGDWAGRGGEIAAFVNGAWLFVAPAVGWRAWGVAETALRVWTGAAWTGVGGSTNLQNVAGVGINATSDAGNRLAVASDATLLSHDGAGHQVKVNKAAGADTASLLFQSNFSGRAEMGLAGNDDFSLKVSPDGSTFETALVVSAGTGITQVKGLTGLTVSIPDDTAVTVTTPVGGGFAFITIVDPDYPQASHSGIFAYDTGVSPGLQTMVLAPQMSNAGTVTLTGTTGTDDASSVSAVGGSLMIENRFGSTRDYNLTFIGG